MKGRRESRDEVVKRREGRGMGKWGRNRDWKGAEERKNMGREK